MVGQPADTKYYQNNNQHTRYLNKGNNYYFSLAALHLPPLLHLLLYSYCLPVILPHIVSFPLHSPENSSQVSVGDGHSHQWQQVGHQEEHQLVHVVHERGGGGTIWPNDQTSCNGHVFAIPIGYSGGEENGGAGQSCTDSPDGDEDGGGGEGGKGMLRDGYGQVSKMECSNEYYFYDLNVLYSYFMTLYSLSLFIFCKLMSEWIWPWGMDSFPIILIDVEDIIIV